MIKPNLKPKAQSQNITPSAPPVKSNDVQNNLDFTISHLSI